jgi:hypothetical protein
MHIKRRSLSKIKSESFLIGILHLIGLLSLCNDNDKKRGHPYVYPTTVMLRCFVVRIWMRIPSVNALHYYLSIDDSYHRRICNACGLDNLPDRRTFDRRFKVLPIRQMIAKMGNIFFLEGLVDGTTASVDNMSYRYLVPIAGFVENVAADPAYDDGKLYRFTNDACVARLVCPIRKYKNTPQERLELVEFYNSREGQCIYGTRKISVEPLFECIKDAFGISVLPVRGFENTRSYVLMCVFVYQLAVYYNCVTGAKNPRCIKHMLGN